MADALPYFYFELEVRELHGETLLLPRESFTVKRRCSLHPHEISNYFKSLPMSGLGEDW